VPREGPGADHCTEEALRRLPPLPPHPVVVDLGSGPGRQTLVLARALNTQVIAIDCHQPYLDQLQVSAAARGLRHLIETRCADFGALEIPPGSVDVIWTEGAAYILGFAESLRRWRVLLSPNGLMAVTECTWLTNLPAAEAKEFWQTGYPEMGTLDENRERARSAGFDVLDTFVLPISAWWDDYYTPLLDRIERLGPTADASLRSLIDETEREIELFRRHCDSYGYAFYLMRRS
jgi:serine/threonine-protein kinase HipA